MNAAAVAWPAATIVATDIDRGSTARLKRAQPGWTVGKCDLRSERSVSRCPALSRWSGAIDLILLNPPFSCRGGRRIAVKCGSEIVEASAALSFVVEATKHLSPTGTLIALLPTGSIHSQKDVSAWDHLSLNFSITRRAAYKKGTFPRSSAHTTIVKLSRRKRPARGRRSCDRPAGPATVTIIRGTCPNHLKRRGTRREPLIHTSNLLDGQVVANGRRGFGCFRRVLGPAVLMPRVGAISPSKIAYLRSGQEIMLSDCVVAVASASAREVRTLHSDLVQNYSLLASAYVGTGAPYLTIARLSNCLRRIGVVSTVATD